MGSTMTEVEPKADVVRPKRDRAAVKRARSRGVQATIVERGSQRICLKEIVSGPFIFKPEDMAHVWCIPIGLSHGAVTFDRAVERVQAFASLNFQNGRDHLPSLIVLADMKQLSPRDRRRISSELEEAGAVFVDWPRGSGSVQEAFQRVATEMRANY